MKKPLFLLLFVFVNYFSIAQNVKISTAIPSDIENNKPIKIETSISKGKISGIARMQFELPKGLKAIEGNNKEAIFSFSKQIVQILWIQLPLDSTISFDFILLPDSNYSGIAEIGGRFSYIDNNKKEEVAMTPVQFKISGHGEKSFEKYKAPIVKAKPVKPTQPVKSKEAIAESKPKPPLKTEAIKPTETKKLPAPKNEIKQAPIENKEKSKTVSKIQENLSGSPNTPVKKENITFKIQLAASASILDKTQLSNQFNYKVETINEELINNMYKYTTGEFLTFKEAKKAFTLNETLKGKAFIVGYKDRKRIDLEEAIQLSK
jgi:hypothetical protein